LTQRKPIKKVEQELADKGLTSQDPDQVSNKTLPVAVGKDEVQGLNNDETDAEFGLDAPDVQVVIVLSE